MGVYGSMEPEMGITRKTDTVKHTGPSGFVAKALLPLGYLCTFELSISVLMATYLGAKYFPVLVPTELIGLLSSGVIQ